MRKRWREMKPPSHLKIVCWTWPRTNHGIRLLQAAVATILLTACSPGNPQKASSETIAKGAEVYEMACAQCHYDGHASAANPSLIGSPTLQANPSAIVGIILHGQSGKSLVDGKPLGGIMPAQAYLTDPEIAAVVTYIRSQFAGISAEVTPAQVQQIRASPPRLTHD